MKIAGGIFLVASLSIIFVMVKDQKSAGAEWQDFKTNYSPVVAVFGQVVEGSKTTVKVDEETGEVGFGVQGYKNNKIQLFTKMEKAIFQKPKVQGNKIKWSEVQKDVDVELHTFDGNLKEFIYIKSENAAKSFIFDLTKDFAESEQIELRDDAGMTVTAVDKKTGEELFTLDYPMAIDAKGKKIPYHYRFIDDKKIIVEAHDPKLLIDVKYPLILDPPMTVREYDELLVKIGQNGNGPGNAKDGDIVTVKPMGWPWGDMEYRDFVIIRVPKMTFEEREKFNARFKSIDDQERFRAIVNREPLPQSRTKHLDGAYIYGLDYVSLINDERVKIFKKNSDGTEEETMKDDLIEIIRNRAKVNPIIDATALNLDEIIKEKQFVLMYKKIKKGKLKLALGELPGDESVLPKEMRLTKRLEEKKSWLARALDKIIKPAKAATNTYTIGTATRNYSTMQAWEDARDAGTDIEKGECYNDSTFTAGVVITGTTGDADSYMWLTVASGNRHSGTAATGVKIALASPNLAVYVTDNYTIVEWLEVTGFSCESCNSWGIAGDYNNNSTFRYNLVHDNVYWASSIGIGHVGQGGDNSFYNNIVYSGTQVQPFTAGIFINYESGTGAHYCYNNTVYLPMSSGGSNGIIDVGSVTVLKNNLVAASVEAFSGSAAGSDYNAGSDTSAPGANSVDNVVAANTFNTVTENSENLHLKAGASSINAGVDLSATFTTDIDNQTRPTGAGTWDIGADELIVNSTPAVSSVSDTPDPVTAGNASTFSVDWSDADAGENIKVKICKTDVLSNQNCSGGYWATSTAFTTDDPEEVTYTAQEADVGTNNYYAYVCDDGGVCVASGSGTAGTFTVTVTPTATSVVDTPDPTNPGRSVSFIVDWNDTGDAVKIKVCKTNALTNQVCDGGSWASSTAFTTVDPVTLVYDVVGGDAGNTRDYAVFVCDSTGLCTTGTTGTFTVNAVSTVPNIKVRGGLRVR